MLPTFINGRRIKPKLSANRIANLRKQILRQGMIWPFENPMQHLRRVDGLLSKDKSREEKKTKKQEAIKEALEKMPDQVKKYKEHMRKQRKPRRLSFLMLLKREYPEAKKKHKI